MAEEVAKKLANHCATGYYKFKDKESKLTIELEPNGVLKVYLKKSLFKQQKVLEFFPDHILTPLYIRGEWKKDLEKLYELAMQK